jgi:hypothetical protein
MPVFRFTWQTCSPLPPKAGVIEVRAEDEIRGHLFARRYVRQERLPGSDLANIQLERTACNP